MYRENLYLAARHLAFGNLSLAHDFDDEGELNEAVRFWERECFYSISVFEVEVERDGSCTRYYCDSGAREVLEDWLLDKGKKAIAVPSRDSAVCFATY